MSAARRTGEPPATGGSPPAAFALSRIPRWTTPLWTSALWTIALLAAVGSLGLALRAVRRRPPRPAALLVAGLAAAYLTLFNPRTQSTTYAVPGAVAALMVALALLGGRRQAATLLALVVGAWSLNRGWLPPIELWLKPLAGLAFFACLVCEIERPARPEARGRGAVGSHALRHSCYVRTAGAGPSEQGCSGEVPVTTHPKSDYIPQCFYRHVADRPDAIYMTQPLGGGRVDDFSYQRTLDEAKRVAAYLRAQNFPKGSKIAIISKNCAHFIISDLAIWMAGHVSVALYPTLTQDIVEYILDHAEVKLVFIGKLDDEPWAQMKPGVPDSLPKVAYPLAPPNEYTKWNDILRDHAPIDDAPERDPDDEALIIYTSGSTGKPKGVLHSFRTISEPTFGGAKLLDVGPDDRMLSYLPLAHSFDRWVSECISLYAGPRLWFAESVDTFVEDLKRAHPTLFVSVPRLWLKFQLGVFKKMPPKKLETYMKIPILSGIVKKKVLTGLGLDAVRFAASGSAPIPPELIAWYNELGLELREGYGMSENFNYSHISMKGRGRPGYVGEPHPEVECKLSPEGEILVKSPGTMLGYFKEPEKTKETFTDDGYLKTGDQGEIDEMGRLKITGRIKELFKTSKGKYVAPVPIENLINANNHIELSLVGGSSQPATFAVLQLSEDIVPEVKKSAQKRAELQTEFEQLLRDVNKQLPNYEQLQFFVVADRPWTIEEGQLTPTMKIKRNVLEKQYEPELAKWYSSGQKVIWQGA